MAATIHELFGSRKVTVSKSGAKSQFLYMVMDAANIDQAYDLVVSTSPLTHTPSGAGVLLREEIDSDILGARKFKFTVNYSSFKPEENADAGTSPPQTGGETPSQGEGNTAPGADPNAVLNQNWSFNTGGGTQHITHSIATISSYVAEGGTATDHKGAINVTAEGIGGVDIHSPEPQLRLKQSVSNFTVGRFVKLCWASCRMNQVAFNGFWPRELLFLGADAPEANSEGGREITYNFAYSPTYVGLVIGDISVTLKEGWNYMWVEYDIKKDETTGASTLHPIAVYIEQVYQEIDFESELGI